MWKARALHVEEAIQVTRHVYRQHAPSTMIEEVSTQFAQESPFPMLMFTPVAEDDVFALLGLYLFVDTTSWNHLFTLSWKFNEQCRYLTNLSATAPLGGKD